MITEKICNAVRMDMEGVSQTGLPLDGFPQEFQTLVLDLVREDAFNLEFTVTSMLSALATAIGNSLWIRVKGSWSTNCSLFVLLVGRPGLGKTPPMSFAFAPIAAIDKKMLEDYKEEMAHYAELPKKEKEEYVERPSICKTILNDFTIEAMLQRHHVNHHGIVVKVDEIRGFFKRVKHNGDDTIEKLLSAWSGDPVYTDRKTEVFPIFVEHPCINMIGCVQTKLMSDTMTQEMVANGFCDRCIVCYPKNQKQKEWEEADEETFAKSPCRSKERWASIINKVLELSNYRTWKEEIFPSRVLDFSPDGRHNLYEWVNRSIRKNNAIEDDEMVSTRDAKLRTIGGRLALVIQVLRWACDESHLDYVDEISVNLAIRLVEYFEECYSRMLAKTVKEDIPDGDAWLDDLPNTFSAKELKQVGFAYGMQYRTIYDHVNKLLTLSNPPIRRVGKGKYEKVWTEQHSAQLAQCTTAQPVPGVVPENAGSADVCADSADVHCADELSDPHNEESNNENESNNE